MIDAMGESFIANSQTASDLAGGSSTIHVTSADPALQIAGSFEVPVLTPIDSNWTGVLAGGAVIILIALMLARSTGQK